MKKIIIAFLFCNTMLAQSNTPILVASGLPSGIFNLDFHNNYVYYTKIEGNHSVSRINIGVPNQLPEIINNNVYTPFGLTIHNNILYFTENIPQRISSINLTQSPLTTTILPIVFSDDGPWNVRVYDNALYFSESVINIKKVPLSNFSQTPTLVATNVPNPWDFIKEGNYLYCTAFADDLVNDVIKLNLLGPVPQIPEFVAQIFEPTSLAKFGNLLFVGSNDSKIYKIDLGSTNPTAELFYEITDEVSWIGQIKGFNNELYFTYNEADFVNEVINGKIMKFSQNQLSNSFFEIVSNVKIYPNPAQTSLNIQADDTIIEASVYNMLGQKENINEISLNSFDVSNLAKGVYIIKLTTENNKTFSSKFIKD